MAFTEFCCRSGGSNLNAGTLTGSSTEPGTGASFTYASGNWLASTGVFTVASGNPLSDGVNVGDFASVYADGSSVTGFVGRVTARDSTTITVSLTVKMGTAPTDGSGTRTLKIGGAWQGPHGSSGFPLTFDFALAKNVAGNQVRVNLKNDQTYDITSAINATNQTQVSVCQGYTSSYGDLGKFTLQGPETGASFVLLTMNGYLALIDAIITRNGNSGSSNGLSLGYYGLAMRVTVHSVRGTGISSTATPLYECEAYSCLGTYGITIGGAMAYRCVSHGNVYGFWIGQQSSCVHCIAYSNSQSGFYADNNPDGARFLCCDAYDNASHGINLSRTVANVVIENCNLIKNGGYGISSNVGYGYGGIVANCGFGAGTQANSSGNITTNAGFGVYEIANFSYDNDLTPWASPSTGDFRIVLADAKGMGRGVFTQTEPSFSGTIAYPDVGAAQSTGGNSGGSRLVGPSGLVGRSY